MSDSPPGLKLKDAMLTGLVEAAIAAVTFGVIAYLFGFLGGGWDTEKKTTAAGAVVLLIIALAFLFSLVKRTFSDTLGRRYMRDRTGIVVTFENLEACKDEMRADFKRAREVRLLLQIGRKELGYHEASYFYNLAKTKDAGAELKILRASADSPFLTEERAQALGEPGRGHYWSEHIRRVGSEIEDLRRNNPKIHIQERLHHEPFLWRIFIFGNIAYISAYLVTKDADLKCKVYRVEKPEKDEDSLYTIFEKYFDYLWRKYDPADKREAKERWATWK
jgi:hypothetical protein